MSPVSISIIIQTLFLFYMNPCNCNAGGKAPGGKNIAEWTIQDIPNYKKNTTLNKLAIENCTTFFEIEDKDTSTQYLKECIAEEESDNANGRVKRSISNFRTLIRERRSERGNVRVFKGGKEFLRSGLRMKVDTPWGIMESNEIIQKSCIGQCMAMKMNFNGEPLRDSLLLKVDSMLSVSNNSEFIVDNCIKGYRGRISRLNNNSKKSVTEKGILRCKMATRFVICISKDTFYKCRETFISTATTKREHNGEIETQEEE